MPYSLKRTALVGAVLVVLGVLGFALARYLGGEGDAADGAKGEDAPAAKREAEGAGAVQDSFVAAQFYVPNPVPAPDFALPTLVGAHFRLAETRGRVVVLNFWATWCGPCRFEMPDFVRMQGEFDREDVLFVGVSLDDEAGPEEVQAFTDELGVNYPVMLDDGSAHAEYGPITSLPTTFVIDREGLIQAYIPGMVTRELLRPMIVDLLDGRSR